MYRLLLILTIGLTILGLACSDDDGGTNSPTNDTREGDVILPLAVGNQWGFVDTQFDSAGTVVSTEVAVFSIWDDTTISDENWYRANMIKGGQTWDWGIYTNRSTGLWMQEASGEGQPPQPVELFLKYPATVGDEYFADEDHGIVTVVSIDTTITVPQGTYSCVLYRYRDADDRELEGDLYCCPDVGRIRTDYYNKTGQGVYFVEDRRELQTLLLMK